STMSWSRRCFCDMANSTLSALIRPIGRDRTGAIRSHRSTAFLPFPMPDLRRCILALALLAAWAGGIPTASAAACSNEEVAGAGEAVNDARQALLALPVGDGMETDVSPEARRAIATMKERLAAFVAASMSCAPADPDPQAIERELAAASHAFKLE